MFMKTNQSREKTAQQIAEVLNNCDMLLNLSLEKQHTKYTLYIETDQMSIEYIETTKDGMNWLLSKLKTHADNKEDIDELLEEIEYLQIESAAI